MVKLRFQRHGRTHAPFYRLVAVDARYKRNGKYLEALGWFNPQPGQGEQDIDLKVDRIKHWLSVGAQPSDTVRDLLGHRDMLTPKQKAAWEADRAYSRKRVEAASAVKSADATIEALTTFVDDADADLGSFLSDAKSAAAEAKAAAKKGQVETAQAAASKAGDIKAAAEKAEAEAAAESSDEGGEDAGE
ncbi:MAG: 30S ribosomal protein S16 [Planctomycetota bacterium]